MTHDQHQVATQDQQSDPRCHECGGPLVRSATGVLSLSATDLCPFCERSA